MNCAEIEVLICDYVDGTLPADVKAELERHLEDCPACAELARDSATAVAFIDSASAVEPPPELITRILFDPPWSKDKNRKAGVRSRFAGWFSPILQPKFAMGAAMTILSFSILSQWAPVRQLTKADLHPAMVWSGLESRVVYVYDQTVKFVEKLKLVYQIQTTLHEWRQQDEEQHPAPKQGTPAPKRDERKLPSNPIPGSPGANPANDNEARH